MFVIMKLNIDKMHSQCNCRYTIFNSTCSRCTTYSGGYEFEYIFDNLDCLYFCKDNKAKLIVAIYDEGKFVRYKGISDFDYDFHEKVDRKEFERLREALLLFS